MSATQMYPSLWEGFPWFMKTGKVLITAAAAHQLYQVSSWLIYPLGKSIILVIGESPTTNTMILVMEDGY